MKSEKKDSFVEMDCLLRDVLKPVDKPDSQVNGRILAQVKEERYMRKHKMPAAVLAAICILLLGSISVAAVVHFLTPANVAEKQGDVRLATALEAENQMTNYESQSAGDYTITFMGLVSGNNITDFPVLANQEVVESETYAVAAIEREDGTPISENASQWEVNFHCAFFVGGLNPYVYQFANSSRAFCEDGVIYCIISSDNMEMFADRDVYLAIYDDTKLLNDLFSFDENTGRISKKESDGEFMALFSVQLDPSKAEPEAAEQYLRELAEEQEMSENDSESACEEFSHKLVTAKELHTEEGREQLRKRGELVLSVPCRIDINEEGSTYVEYSYEIDGLCKEGKRNIESNWKEYPAGTWIFMGYGECGDGNSEEDMTGYAEYLYKETDGNLTMNIFRITDGK